MIQYMQTNLPILDTLLHIDNQIMATHLTSEEIMKNAQKTFCKKIILDKPTLILYDGSPDKTIQIINSCEGEAPTILYPSFSFLGVNHFLVKPYSFLSLSQDKNPVRYQVSQDLFEQIYVIGEEVEWLEWQQEFPKAIWWKEKANG